VKISRVREFYQNLRKGAAKLIIDNSKALLGYETGVMGPGGQQGGNDEQQQRRSARKRPLCKHCRSTTHLRRMSLQCTANPKLVVAKNEKQVIVGGTSCGLVLV
jgi:hypothetical protein